MKYKCTRKCFCDNTKCSIGCGFDDGWRTAGGYCEKDGDVNIKIIT
jgi:hypothetical protein